MYARVVFFGRGGGSREDENGIEYKILNRREEDGKRIKSVLIGGSTANVICLIRSRDHSAIPSAAPAQLTLFRPTRRRPFHPAFLTNPLTEQLIPRDCLAISIRLPTFLRLSRRPSKNKSCFPRTKTVLYNANRTAEEVEVLLPHPCVRQCLLRSPSEPPPTPPGIVASLMIASDPRRHNDTSYSLFFPFYDLFQTISHSLFRENSLRYNRTVIQSKYL